MSRADLMIYALEANSDRPCFQSLDETRTYRAVRERTSQFLQAFRALGIAPGSRLRLLAGNVGEVPYIMLATGITRTSGGALHPRGSLADHTYVLQDSGAEVLIFGFSK